MAVESVGRSSPPRVTWTRTVGFTQANGPLLVAFAGADSIRRVREPDMNCYIKMIRVQKCSLGNCYGAGDLDTWTIGQGQSRYITMGQGQSRYMDWDRDSPDT